MATRTMLDVSNLCSSYGNIKAVDGVDLRVAEGTITALIGANGSGKSTTMKALSGHHPPVAGTVVFDGEDITGWAPHRIVRRGLAFLPERPLSVLAPLSIEENLVLSRSAGRGDASALLERCYEIFPFLRDRRRQIAGTLSGGEQQMMAFARILMTDPAMILIDSPAIGLSPSMTDAVYEVIARLRAEGQTMLLIEQSAELALVVSDHVYLLHRGRNQLDGPAAELRGSKDLVDAYLA